MFHSTAAHDLLFVLTSDKNMNGYLGMTAQWIVDGKLVSSALALRYLPKGDSGHTIAVIHDAIVAELTELAQLISSVYRTLVCQSGINIS
jgi:hypothetical protein